MKATDFIYKDLEKSQGAEKVILSLSIILSLAMTALGLGFRRDFVEAFTLHNLFPPLLMFVTIGASLWAYAKSEKPWSWKIKAILIFSALALGLSLVQPETPISLSKFQNSNRFWPETFHCLALGLFCSFIASIILTLIVFKFLPTPNQRQQMLCAMISGLCGLTALTLHCMGPLLSHTFIAHWGQAALIFPIAYFEQKACFAIVIKKTLYQNKSLKNISKLGL